MIDTVPWNCRKQSENLLANSMKRKSKESKLIFLESKLFLFILFLHLFSVQICMFSKLHITCQPGSSEKGKEKKKLPRIYLSFFSILY